MAVTLPGTYELIVEKFNTTDPTKTWRNTWTITATTVPAETGNIVGAIQAFEIACCWNDSTVGTFKLYNWARGRQPYPDGEPLWERVLDTAGGAHTAWGYLDELPLPAAGGEVVVRVDRLTSGGKPGRLFFRSIPRDIDITAVSGGRWTVDTGRPITDASLQSIVTGSAINEFFGGGSSGQQLTVVRYSKKTNTVNGIAPVTSMHFIDVTTNRQTRKNKR
jgi:hypothetical protein